MALIDREQNSLLHAPAQSYSISWRYIAAQLQAFSLQFRVTSCFEEPPQDIRLACKLIKLRWCQAALLNNPINPCQLLGSIVATLAKLLEDLDIILSILVLGLLFQIVSCFAGLSSHLSNASATGELGNKFVQNLNRAGRGIETTTNQPMSASL